jgi:hypothetical protein
MALAAAAPAMGNDMERMMYLDTLHYLPGDILTKVDRASMAVSLEARVPFLDPAVVALAWRLPLAWKVRAGQGKWILREVLARHVPRALFERPKRGFAVPIDQWLRGPLRDWAEALLEPQRLAEGGYFHPAPIRAAWQAHLAGGQDDAQVHVEQAVIALGQHVQAALDGGPVGKVHMGVDGPRGGDEINVIKEGGDYGWPFVSYGQPYGGGDYVRPTKTGTHTGYPEPIKYWVPSIAPTELVQLPTQGWASWGRALVLGTLAEEVLVFMKINDNFEITEEVRLNMNERIRDLEVLSNGSLIATTDSGKLITVSN